MRVGQCTGTVSSSWPLRAAAVTHKVHTGQVPGHPERQVPSGAARNAEWVEPLGKQSSSQSPSAGTLSRSLQKVNSTRGNACPFPAVLPWLYNTSWHFSCAQVVPRWFNVASQLCHQDFAITFTCASIPISNHSFKCAAAPAAVCSAKVMKGVMKGSRSCQPALATWCVATVAFSPPEKLKLNKSDSSAWTRCDTCWPNLHIRLPFPSAFCRRFAEWMWGINPAEARSSLFWLF